MEDGWGCEFVVWNRNPPGAAADPLKDERLAGPKGPGPEPSEVAICGVVQLTRLVTPPIDGL